MTKIFAISLPRSVERHAYIRQELPRKSRLPYEILGIDAMELRANGAAWPHNPKLRDSQVGCALSHVEACRRIVDQKLPSALVIEDDVSLPKDIDKIVATVSAEIEPGEVISLYNRTILPEKFSTYQAFEFSDRRLLRPMESRYMRTAAAYVIQLEAAEAIVRLNTPINILADNWMWFYQSGGVSGFRLLYPLAIRLHPFPSTLSSDRGSTGTRLLKRILNITPGFQTLREMRRRRIEQKRENNVVLTNLPSDMARKS